MTTSQQVTTAEEYRPVRATLAGFTAGYVMSLAGYWFQAVLGIGELDFAHTGLRYVAGGRPGWWIVSVIFHLIDSVLLGLLYARVVHRPLRWLTRPFGPLWQDVASGMAFGVGVWTVVAMLIAMPFMGAGVFGWKTGSAKPALKDLVLHLVFGLLLGSIYGGGRRER